LAKELTFAEEFGAVLETSLDPMKAHEDAAERSAGSLPRRNVGN
jgi:hypothetical protein